MDDFTTRTYGTSGLDNRPLFGETSARVGTFFTWPKSKFAEGNETGGILSVEMNGGHSLDGSLVLRLIVELSPWQDRIINLAVGGFTSLVVLVSTDFFYGLRLYAHLRASTLVVPRWRRMSVLKCDVQMK